MQQHFTSFLNLTHLYLDHNNLQIIKNYTFMLLENLCILSADANQITTLEQHSFFGLHRLIYLDLSHNKIMEINLGDLPSGVLVGLQTNQIIGGNGLLGLPHESHELFQYRIYDGCILQSHTGDFLFFYVI